MILNVLIISILIIFLIVPSSTNVCNFIGHACSLNNINSSYFTQLDYLHDSEIGDSWILKNNQALIVSGRLVSDLLIPPYGPSPHCLMIRYSITGNALIRLIVITQSDDYEARFCYESDDIDGDVKKISVPFSMYSHTHITLDISMSSYENCAFYLESFWVVRDDCYNGFKERMTQCREYIESKNNRRLITTATTDPSESTTEMKSLHFNGTNDQWSENVANQVNNSANSKDIDQTVKSRQMPSKSSATASLLSTMDSVSTTSSLTLDNLTSEIRSKNRIKFLNEKNNVTILPFELLSLNETTVQDFSGESQAKKIEANQTKTFDASKANSGQVNVTLAINSFIENYSENVTERHTETTNSNDTRFNSFLPCITTESWRSEMVISNSSNTTSEFLEGKMDQIEGKTEIMDSRLAQSTLSPTEQKMFTFIQSNSSAIADNITAASITFTEYPDNIFDGIKDVRNETKVSLKPTFNKTAGVQSETENSYVDTESTIVITEASENHITPLSTKEMKKLDIANSSSFTQDTNIGEVENLKFTQIGKFVHESKNYDPIKNNQFNDSTSTPMMQLDGNITKITSTKYPSSEYQLTTQSVESPIQLTTVSASKHTFNVDVNETKVTKNPNYDKFNLTTNEKHFASVNVTDNKEIVNSSATQSMQDQIFNSTPPIESESSMPKAEIQTQNFTEIKMHSTTVGLDNTSFDDRHVSNRTETSNIEATTSIEALNVTIQTDIGNINTKAMTPGTLTLLQHHNGTTMIVSSEEISTDANQPTTALLNTGEIITDPNYDKFNLTTNEKHFASVNVTDDGEIVNSSETQSIQNQIFNSTPPNESESSIQTQNFTEIKMHSTTVGLDNTSFDDRHVSNRTETSNIEATTSIEALNVTIQTDIGNINTKVMTPGTLTLLQHHNGTTMMVSSEEISTDANRSTNHANQPTTALLKTEEIITDPNYDKFNLTTNEKHFASVNITDNKEIVSSSETQSVQDQIFNSTPPTERESEKLKLKSEIRSQNLTETKRQSFEDQETKMHSTTIGLDNTSFNSQRVNNRTETSNIEATTSTEALNVTIQTDIGNINTKAMTPGTLTLLQHHNGTTMMVSSEEISTVPSSKYTFYEYSADANRSTNHANQPTTVSQRALLNTGKINTNFATTMSSTSKHTFNVDVNETKVTKNPNYDKFNLTTNEKHFASVNVTDNKEIVNSSATQSMQDQIFNSTPPIESESSMPKAEIQTQNFTEIKMHSTTVGLNNTSFDDRHVSNRSETDNIVTTTSTESLNSKIQTNREGINTTELTTTSLQLQNDTDISLMVSSDSVSTAYSTDESKPTTHASQINETVIISPTLGVINYTNFTNTISSITEYTYPAYSVTKSSSIDQTGNVTVSVSPMDSNDTTTSDYYESGVISLNGDSNKQYG